MIPKINRKWVAQRRTMSQTTFYTELISDHGTEMPNLADLILLLMSISPGTGPLERSFSKLGKLCFKDRSRLFVENIETEWLLSVLDIKPEKNLLVEACKVIQN